MVIPTTIWCHAARVAGFPCRIQWGFFRIWNRFFLLLHGFRLLVLHNPYASSLLCAASFLYEIFPIERERESSCCLLHHLLMRFHAFWTATRFPDEISCLRPLWDFHEVSSWVFMLFHPEWHWRSDDVSWRMLCLLWLSQYFDQGCVDEKEIS